MADLQKIIKVTQAQYDILKAGGTVGDYTGIDPNYLYLVKDTNVWATDTLAPVAFSGDYNDLINVPTIPTVNNGIFTIQANGTNATFFTANQSGNKTLNIKGSGGTTVTKSDTNEITISTGAIPTKTSDLSNDNLLYRKVYNVDSVTRPTSNSNYVVYHITAPEITSYEEGLTIRVHKSLASD